MIVVKINKLGYLRILSVVACEYALGIEVTRILQTAAYSVPVQFRSVLFVFVVALPKNW